MLTDEYKGRKKERKEEKKRQKERVVDWLWHGGKWKGNRAKAEESFFESLFFPAGQKQPHPTISEVLCLLTAEANETGCKWRHSSRCWVVTCKILVVYSLGSIRPLYLLGIIARVLSY